MVGARFATSGLCQFFCTFKGCNNDSLFIWGEDPSSSSEEQFCNIIPKRLVLCKYHHLDTPFGFWMHAALGVCPTFFADVVSINPSLVIYSLICCASRTCGLAVHRGTGHFLSPLPPPLPFQLLCYNHTCFRITICMKEMQVLEC